MAQPRKIASSDFIRFFSARPADRSAFSVERRGSFRMSARMKNKSRGNGHAEKEQ